MGQEPAMECFFVVFNRKLGGVLSGLFLYWLNMSFVGIMVSLFCVACPISICLGIRKEKKRRKKGKEKRVNHLKKTEQNKYILIQ